MIKVWLLGIGFLFGIILGSLTKALADRSLTGKSFWGRSYCPKCKHKLRAYDLLPVISFITLRGKCRYCHKKIGRSYLTVELILGCLVGYLFFISSANFPGIEDNLKLISFALDLAFKSFALTILVILTITDFKETLIPNRIVIPAIWMALILLLVQTIYKIWYLYYYLSLTPIGKMLLPPHSDYFRRHAFMVLEPVLYSLITSLAIGGFFLFLIFITKGKGMGGGDVKLGSFMGLVLGFPGAIIALVLAFFTGALVALGLIAVKKKKFGQTIPFGPFLALGSIMVLFWGNQILDWYLHLSI